ncbi:MAG: hypothetical protein LUG95_03060 [Clostridiales bacterium]|nr:hypothetical protein [Clostridiales bacterium]
MNKRQENNAVPATMGMTRACLVFFSTNDITRSTPAAAAITAAAVVPKTFAKRRVIAELAPICSATLFHYFEKPIGIITKL